MQGRRNRGAEGPLPDFGRSVNPTPTIKGVSDLETCTNYFALQGKILENLMKLLIVRILRDL